MATVEPRSHPKDHNVMTIGPVIPFMAPVQPRSHPKDHNVMTIGPAIPFMATVEPRSHPKDLSFPLLALVQPRGHPKDHNFHSDILSHRTEAPVDPRVRAPPACVCIFPTVECLRVLPLVHGALALGHFLVLVKSVHFWSSLNLQF